MIPSIIIKKQIALKIKLSKYLQIIPFGIIKIQ